MKYTVQRFKDLTTALKAIERFVKDDQQLVNGRPKRLGGLRPRELLANWLVCVVYNSSTEPDRLCFTSDPIGGDGIIVDNKTGETWPTEHVLAMRSPKTAEAEDVGTTILNAIRKKQHKGGAAYASGKTLIVFIRTSGGAWYPTKVARELPQPLGFDTVWVVDQKEAEADEYAYSVTSFEVGQGGDAPVFSVRIGSDFCSWEVKRVQ